MNTDNDSPTKGHGTPKKLEQLKGRTSEEPGRSRSAAEAELETELSNERDGRREDRFLFAVTLIVIFDIWAMKDVDTWTVPVVVGVIELFFLLIFARRMGVEEIHFWLNQLLPHFKMGLKKPEESAAQETRTPPETKASAPKPDQKKPPKGE